MKSIIFILATLVGCAGQETAPQLSVLATKHPGAQISNQWAPAEYNVGGSPSVSIVGGSRIAAFQMSDYFPQCHIINAGRGGATSSDMAEAIQDAMAETSDILIVSVGVNNYHRGSESRILQDIASMIEKARSINPDVEIYITGITPTLSMNEWNLKIACINPEIESLCAKSGVAYLSIADMESGIALAAPYTSDGVHYTAAGYDVLARIIKSAVGI